MQYYSFDSFQPFKKCKTQSKLIGCTKRGGGQILAGDCKLPIPTLKAEP